VDTLPILTSSQGHTLIARVARFCQAHDLVHPGTRIIVGLSGGPDSVFLLHALVALRDVQQLTLIAAHLDHGWRTTSAEDVAFCATLTNQLNVPFVHEHARNLAKMFNSTRHTTGSLEDQGRRMRRTFFERVQHEHQAGAIALAHHQDDQHETFFIRLTRGAGLAGLAGIRPKAKQYIHPLLCCTKREILDTLHEHALPYQIDATNTDQKFLRNRIRTHLLPCLHNCDNRSQASLTRAIEQLQETDAYLEQATEKLLESMLVPANHTIGHTNPPKTAHPAPSHAIALPSPLILSEVEGGASSGCKLTKPKNLWICCATLCAQHPYMQKRLVLNWLIRAGVPFTPSEALLEEILRFLRTDRGGTHSPAQTWHIIKKKCYAGIALKSAP